MPEPEYIPLGRASARPSTTSMAEIDPSWPTSPRTMRARLKGSITPERANSATLGRSSVPTSMSRKGVGTWRLTTRIISSGVMPLAAIEATKAPALVPT
jgi:hypothetical protein